MNKLLIALTIPLSFLGLKVNAQLNLPQCSSSHDSVYTIVLEGTTGTELDFQTANRIIAENTGSRRCTYPSNLNYRVTYIQLATTTTSSDASVSLGKFKDKYPNYIIRVWR